MFPSLVKRSAPSVAAFLLVFALSSATAEEFSYRDRVSGTAAPSGFDVNNDGVPAHYVTFAGWSTVGMVNGGFLVEYDFLNLQPDVRCPDAMIRAPILASASNRAVTIRALTLEGGQFFMQDDAETALFCLNPSTGAVYMSIQGRFAGGLGVFEGATGEYSYEGDGQVLVQEGVTDEDPVPLPFGAFTLETRGTINVPR